jgi:TolB protein
MRKKQLYFLTLISLGLFLFKPAAGQTKTIGLFESQADIANVFHKGSVLYDSKTQKYTLEGSGYNVWGSHDEFHFIWNKMKGTLSLRPISPSSILEG